MDKGKKHKSGRSGGRKVKLYGHFTFYYGISLAGKCNRRFLETGGVQNASSLKLYVPVMAMIKVCQRYSENVMQAQILREREREAPGMV